MPLYDTVSGLPLEVESYALEGLAQDISPELTRRTTVVRLQGGGHEGVGEDVTYDGDDQGRLQEAGPVQPLAGSWTFASFSERLGELDLFPEAPSAEVYRNYRRWAFESAALDLALRQAGRSLAEVVGREPRPVTFVASMRLGEPASIAPVRALARSLSSTQVQARPDELLGRRARRGAGGDGRGRLGRPEGFLQGHPGRPACRPRALCPCRRRPSRRLDRGSGADRGD